MPKLTLQYINTEIVLNDSRKFEEIFIKFN